MTMTAISTKQFFSGNASATAFAFSFRVRNAAHIEVWFKNTSDVWDATALVKDTDYTVALNTNGTGTVTYPITGTALAVGEELLIRMAAPYDQLTDLTNQGPYNPETLERDSFDQLARQTQQLDERASRSLRQPLHEVTQDMTIPNVAARAGKYQAYGPTGLPVVLDSTGTSPTLADLSASTGAGLIGRIASGTGAVTRTVQATLNNIVRLLDYIPVAQHAAIADGTTVYDATTDVQRALDYLGTLGGGVLLPSPGTYLMDTIDPSSNTVIFGDKSITFKFVAHATTKNAQMDIGDVSAGVENVTIQGFRLDGQKATQTGGANFEHGIRIWGSSRCQVIDMEIFDQRGDGVYIGHHDGRSTDPSNMNKVLRSEIYGQTRQGIALTYGNENEFAHNNVSGTIDIEIDSASFECKNNHVHHNSGRNQTEALSSPRISDLLISTSGAGPDTLNTSGNIIDHNTCYKIQGQYNDSLIVTGNIVIGSETTETFLMSFDGCNNLMVNGTVFEANVSVATALTALIRTRGGDYVTVVNSTGDDGGLPFHNYSSSFGTAPTTANLHFNGNLLNGGGDYRTNGSCPFLTEESVYKITTSGANPQVFTFTHESGPILADISATPSGAKMSLSIGWASAAGFYRVTVETYGEVGAGAEPYDETVIANYDISGSSRIIDVFTAPLGASLTYVQYNFANSGTVGTIFVKIRY